jgi:transposase
VYQVHDWAKVRELHRQGISKKAIARRLGMSRNTVARLVASERPPRHERARVGSLLDPFKDEIEGLLADDHRVAATVVLERLRPCGYRGGISILKEHLLSAYGETCRDVNDESCRFTNGETCRTPARSSR